MNSKRSYQQIFNLQKSLFQILELEKYFDIILREGVWKEREELRKEVNLKWRNKNYTPG